MRASAGRASRWTHRAICLRAKPVMTPPPSSSGTDSAAELAVAEGGDLLAEESEGLAEDSGSELRTMTIGMAQHGARLDRALVDLVPEFSRSYLQQLLAQGLVSLQGKPALKASAKVKAGDQVELLGPNRTPEQLALDGATIDYEVIARLGRRLCREYVS